MKRLLLLLLVALCPLPLLAQKDTMTDLGAFFSDAENNTKAFRMPAEKLARVAKQYPLLASIERYDPTDKGKLKKPFAETYDYRITSGASLPPTLVDCFIADLMLLYEKDGGTAALSSKSIPADAAMQAMDVYRKKDASDVIGYRPYTHWSFVRSLTSAQQKTLAGEVSAYVAAYGVEEE